MPVAVDPPSASTDAEPDADLRVSVASADRDVVPSAAVAGAAPGQAQLARRMVLAVAAAFALYVALAVWSDIAALQRALVGFRWDWLPLALGLTVLNYCGRLAKWLWYLDVVGADVPRPVGVRIFGVGMAMVLTPGKVGELLKSVMVRGVSGASMARTMPIVLAERLTDGLAMMLLAGIGLWGLDDPRVRLPALLALVAMVAVVAAVQFRPLADWLLGRGERLSPLAGLMRQARHFYESAYTLLGPRNLAVSIAIGLVSWLCEGLAFYVVLRGLGVPPSGGTALTAVFIFSVATIVGAVVATPGGLGGVEGTLVVLSTALLGLDEPSATAAALIIRLATLWFGVAIGLASLAAWPHLLAASAARPASGRAS